MCGIAGVFGAGCGPEEVRRAAAIGADLAHRGPDGEGLAAFDDAVLAHRRLAIQDLTPAAAQPMAHPAGPVLVYNGEIYNAPELRRRLEHEGEAFRGTGDTEVLLAACARWGVPRALEAVEGIFAFALYDPRDRTLWLARDRMGVKPLHVADGADGRTWFGSELGGLVRHAPLARDLDPRALGAYAVLGFVPGPATIWRAARSLRPGTWLRLSAGGRETGTYGGLPGVYLPYDDAVERLRDLIVDAVERQLVSDVPLGAFLSGGLDSSIVCAAVTKRLGRALHTFSIGYDDDPVIDESRWAALVAAHLGTTHTLFTVAARDLQDAAGPALAGLGQPFADPSLVPTYLVSRLARGHVTVALSGDGADELFAGYSKYLVESLRARWKGTPGALRGLVTLALQLAPSTRAHRAGETVRRARKFVEAAALPARERWIALQAVLRPVSGVARLYRAPLDAGWLAARVDEELAGRDDLLGMRGVDLAITLPDRMLFKVDHASMAVGLEIRVPFLDEAVVAAARLLEPNYLLRGTTRKRILRDAGLPWLPPEMEHRPKQGFDAPIGRWLEGPLREPFLDRVRSSAASGLLDAGAVERLLARHASGREAAEHALWSAYCLATWAEEFRPSA